MTRNRQQPEAHRKGKAREPRPETNFEQACREAGLKPATVRSRMKPRAKGGQGLTLEEALRQPVASPESIGQKGRARSPWYRGGEGVER